MSIELGGIVGLVVCASVGLILLWISLRLVRTGDISLIHDYNYGNVPMGKRPEFARQVGRHMMPMSVTTLLMSAAFFLPEEWIGGVIIAFVVAMLFECVLCCRVVVRYNGSIFG